MEDLGALISMEYLCVKFRIPGGLKLLGGTRRWLDLTTYKHVRDK